MPTTKKRINITIADETYEALAKLSAKRAKSVSSVSLNLIEDALELQEDIYFSRVADERLSKPHKRIPHSKAWD